MIRLLFRVTGEGGAVTLHSAEVHGSKSALLLRTPIADIIGFEDCRDINPRISIGYAEQIALAKQNCTLREIIAKNKLWVPQNVGSNPEDKPVVDAIKGQQIPSSQDMGLGGTAMDYRDLYESHRQGIKPDLSQVSLDALKDEIALRELVKKREENPPDKPVSEIGPDGGFLVPPSIAKQIESEFPPAGPAGFICVDDPGAQEPPNPESVAEFFRETCASRRKKAEEEAQEDPRVLHGNGLRTKLWLMLRPNGEFVKSTTEEGGESYIACTSLDEAQKVAEQQKIYDIDCVPHRVF